MLRHLYLFDLHCLPPCQRLIILKSWVIIVPAWVSQPCFRLIPHMVVVGSSHDYPSTSTQILWLADKAQLVETRPVYVDKSMREYNGVLKNVRAFLSSWPWTLPSYPSTKAACGKNSHEAVYHALDKYAALTWSDWTYVCHGPVHLE